MEIDLSSPEFAWVKALPEEALEGLAKEIDEYLEQSSLFDFYPETGPLRRELYTKHMEFFKAGAKYRERCFMAANRVGKTLGAGGYECALHATGLYPDWWEGKRFTKPIRLWVAGKFNETTRDIVQAKMFGEVTGSKPKRLTGTGLIPKDLIGEPTWKSGIQNLLDNIKIKHASGGWSLVGVKSYQQGRGSFEGTEQDVIWLDEEPPLEVYSECLVRTMTTNGLVMITFTPLGGMSDVVLSFITKELSATSREE